MTNLKTHIAPVRNALRIGDFQAITAVNAIESTLFPTDPAPNPTKQFVVGEWYGAVSPHSDNFIPKKCLFVTPTGRMVYVNSYGNEAISVQFDNGAWRHMPVGPKLDAAKAEIAELETKLAAVRVRVKEMEG